MEYCGHTVNFKTHRQSYKIKKTIENPPDQWKIFRNTHEAIVDEETFDRVQELRRNKRRPAKTGKSNLFSGVPTVPIAEKSCTTAPRKTLRSGKITLFVLPLGRKAKMRVEHTLSVQWYWKRVY